MDQYMWIIYLSLFVIFLIIEAIGTDLVTIWFAIGSVIALILSVIPGVAWWVSLIAFIVISIACFLCLRPLAMKLMKANIVSSNVDELIHKKALVVKDIDELNYGEVKLNGVLWTAISQDGKLIKEGKVVDILSIEGNKLIVKESINTKGE